MKDFGYPPVFPSEEEETPKEKETSDVIIPDKAKGKKVVLINFVWKPQCWTC